MDDDKQEAPQTPDPDSIRVGRRLAAIREELGRHFGEAEWSQTAVARKLKLTQNIVWRIEQEGGGKIDNWFKLMRLYEANGYNLHWILAENNALVSKFELQEATSPNQLIEELLKKLDHYQALLGGEISAVRQLILNSVRN
jgi:transcriptional regulator with XRE-family HTH domain